MPSRRLLWLTALLWQLSPTAADNTLGTPASLLKEPGPSFKRDHPRLPRPSQEYLEALRGNAAEFARFRKEADGVDAASPRSMLPTTMLYVMALATGEPTYLNKIKALFDARWSNWGVQWRLYYLAYAYDWFYERLTPTERSALAENLEAAQLSWEAGMVDVAPSPFNDVGYNRYEAAGMTGAIALNLDHPRGADHLKLAMCYFNDALPVWRHVMGADGGGWHEGREYIAIGIAKVIAPLCDEWRSATGQDLYRENPWLQNLIHYAIYTARPDRTPSRLADVAWCTTISDSAVLPLSLEYRNPYGLWFARHDPYAYGAARPTGMLPSRFPWGPPDRPDNPVKPPDDLPLVRHFDGTGEVVMRSGWTEDDTLITFKCGDNYWSHSNMDQGAFTIYRRGALAIDSGAYFHYGDPHHFNYRRQAISKNVITVTDPNDTVVRKMPDGSQVRIANDGGQRRVAGEYGIGAPSAFMNPQFLSQWPAWRNGGMRGPMPLPPGPDSLTLWRQRREEFHTGSMLAFEPHPRYVYVVGDLTPAYTNSLSGTGSFQHRSKRVRKFLRTLLYLASRYVAVFDVVDSFDPRFKKRWLLHSVNEPTVERNLVAITRADLVRHRHSWPEGLKYRSKDRLYYQYGGRLFCRTLLPEDFEIIKVGGPGREFEVDGTNYGATLLNNPFLAPDGQVSADPAKGPPEPGAWRVEVSPRVARELDLFLHVMLPTESTARTMPPAQLVQDTQAVGFTLEDDDARYEVRFSRAGLGGHVRIVRKTGEVWVDKDFETRVLPNPSIQTGTATR